MRQLQDLALTCMPAFLDLRNLYCVSRRLIWPQIPYGMTSGTKQQDFSHLHQLYHTDMTATMNGHTHPSGKGSLSPIQEYAKELVSAADTITEYCASSNQPQPAFDSAISTINIPPTAPLNVQMARQTLISSAERLQQTVIEPTDYLPHLSINVSFPMGRLHKTKSSICCM